jgi:hypothetical protein
MAVSLKENNWFFVTDQTPRPPLNVKITISWRFSPFFTKNNMTVFRENKWHEDLFCKNGCNLGQNNHFSIFGGGKYLSQIFNHPLFLGKGIHRLYAFGRDLFVFKKNFYCWLKSGSGFGLLMAAEVFKTLFTTFL